MKGVILAGGNGTRLRPCTEVTNKHLLPVYDWPMLFYPINTLKGGGVDDICVVLGGNSIGDIVNLCGDGSRFGVRLTYKHQQKAGGIAEALLLAEDFVGEDDVAVILGDNIFLSPVQLDWVEAPTIFYTEHKNPREFGCIQWNPDKDEDYANEILNIVEKPHKPPSSDIVTGLYVYNGMGLFHLIRTLNYSARGELEVTDLNNKLNELHGLNAVSVPGNTWYDAGSIDSIQDASKAAKKHKSSKAYRVFFPEED